MRPFLNGLAIGLVLAVGAGVIAQTVAQSPIRLDGASFTESATKACLFPAGGWTTIDASTTAALSAQMNAWSRYVIQCDDDAYIAPGTSAAVADTSDGWLAAGAWVEFLTDGDVRYVSVRNKNNTDDCHYIECK